MRYVSFKDDTLSFMKSEEELKNALIKVRRMTRLSTFTIPTIIDGIKAMSRGISGGKQVIKFSKTSNRGRVYLFS